MKLNNKGFAITGILYTVFVLFLMILLSVLGGLNIKRQSLEKNIENIKDEIEGTECQEYASGSEISVITNGTETGYITKYQGKYFLNINGTPYQTYIKKGVTLDLTTLSSNLTYIGIDNSNNKPTSFNNTSITKICTTDTIE